MTQKIAVEVAAHRHPDRRTLNRWTRRRARAWTVLAILLAALTPATAGAQGAALDLGGTNAYVTFGANSTLGLPTFTLELWFKREGTGSPTGTGIGGVLTAVPLISKGRNQADAGDNLDMNYFLGIRTTDNVLCADFEEGNTGLAGNTPSLNHPVFGMTPIVNNVWYHAAATYDGTTWRLYLNGIQEAEFIVGQPPRAPVQRATLTLWSTNSSNDGGTFYRVADPGWVEGDRTGIDGSSVGGPGLKWTDVDTNHDNTVDALDSSPFVPTFTSPLAALGAVPARKFVTVDLTAAFQNGPGLYSLAIRNTSNDGATFASAQWPTTSQRPLLHLELASPAPFVFSRRASAATPPCPKAMIEADLPVSASRPTENFGASDQLGACALPEKRTFLRVLVSGVGEQRVASVRLGLTADSVSGAESDSAGRLWWIADCDWDELAATWDTQPDTTDAVLLDVKGSIATNESVSFDVTAAVSGDGVYCFVLESPSEDEVIYRASEAADGGPEVQITVDGNCTGGS